MLAACNACNNIQACHDDGPADHELQADHKMPSLHERNKSDHSAAAAADAQGKDGASRVQKPGASSPSISRQRAEAAVTSAPPRQSTSAHAMHAGASLHSHDGDARRLSLQPLMDTQEASHATSRFNYSSDQTHGKGSRGRRSGSQASDEQAFVPQAAASEDSSAACSAGGEQPTTDKESELEATLSELTLRLAAAEEAAGHHSEIQSQLMQLKSDKTALQDDLKQFMQHTSSMLTTIQAQMSRLMVPGAGNTASISAENSHASAASMHFSQGLPATVLPAIAPALGGANLSSPTTCAPARSSLHDWQLESHGSQPSPLARHDIFQHDTSPRGSQQAASSISQPAEFGSWMTELQQGLGSRSKQVH